MVCLEVKVKWWKVLSPTSHVVIKKSQCIDLEPGIYAELPDGTKRYFTAEESKVSLWNWDKLDVAARTKAKQLFANNKFRELTEMHNTYKLTDNYICCDTESVRLNFREAIANNLI